MCARSKAMNYLRRKAWSPWTAGIVVGLVQIPALLDSDCDCSNTHRYTNLCPRGAKVLER